MRRRVGRVGLEIWLPIVVVAVWWLASDGSTSLFFPPLRKIVQSFGDTFLNADGLKTNVVPSVTHLAVGYALAIVLGVGLGVVLALNRWVRDGANPLMHFLRALPAPALLPFAIVAIGIGASMKVAIIAFGAMFPILLNTLDGVRGIDPTVLDTCDSYRLSTRWRLRAVIVPGALPQIFTGLRVGLQVALLLMVVSEIVASTGGIGYLIIQSQQEFTTPKMWAGILLLGLLGYLLNLLFNVVERRALRWYFGAREGAAR
jgi:ABC-type nitrate/sulfonate/bicarbonate transport system permease component